MTRRRKGAKLTPDELEQQRLRGAVGGLARSAKLSAEERSAIARKAGIASAAKRRAEREAAGYVVKSTPRTVMPSMEELEPYLEAIDAEPRETPWTYEQRIRDAIIRQRRDVALAALEAAKRRAGQ
ncbi:hypothetical protein ACFM35_05025 [Microbacterium sp. P01]|uniref:hypothetical protein n=1 Tax=Microbacterium sp. P01 TaxID=3366261 RepID=UPI00366F8309